MKQLGEILKTLREKAGLTQRDVSDTLGYSTPQFISNNERGISAPPLRDIPKLARLYNTDSSYLFGCLRDAKLRELSTKLNKQFNMATYR